MASAPWPALAIAEWEETRNLLHLMTQIVGKYRLARTPWVNHSWHATLYLTPRGLTTGPVYDGGRAIEAVFDLLAGRLLIRRSSGDGNGVALEPMSVADFRKRFRAALKAAGADDGFHGAPNEVLDPVPFARDTVRRPFDGAAALRFHAALLSMAPVFERFRTGFLGKVSPLHLFWGSFDLALTRFSGRPAPPHPGGIPALPDCVSREAYSHEVSSAGFWPGGQGAEAFFYAYSYPTPTGFAEAPVGPAAAGWDGGLGEFVLPYEAVRSSRTPDEDLLTFLQSTHQAAARLADWDAALEAPLGEPRVPRPLD